MPEQDIKTNKIYRVVGTSSITGRQVRIKSVRPGDTNDLCVSVELMDHQTNDPADPIWVMRPCELIPIDCGTIHV